MCRLRTVAEVKQPLVEITQSPTTVVLSVCLAACHPYHYHKGQICSANGILHTHTHVHAHAHSSQRHMQQPPKMLTQHLTQIRAFWREHLQDETHVHPGTFSFYHIAVFWLQYVITWLE